MPRTDDSPFTNTGEPPTPVTDETGAPARGADGESATLEPPAAPKRRRARTSLARAKKPALRIGGVIVALSCVAVLGLAGQRMLTAQVGAGEQLDAAAVLIEEADAIVVQVDTVVRSDVTTGLAETANLAANRVPEGQQQLEAALRSIEIAEQKGNRRDQERAQIMSEAANARLDMLEQAPVILRLNAQAAEALPLARAGWESVLAADQSSDQAVAAYNKLTQAGVKESRKLNLKAAEQLALARDQFTQAEAAFPEAAFDAYIVYVDTRIQLNELSQQSDTAWLDDDTGQANAIIAQYNTLDATGVSQAQALPKSPEQAIAEAYEEAAREATNAYYNARDAATAADERLR